MSWRGRNTLVQALSHQTPHHQPSRTCVVEAVPPVGVGTPWGSSVSHPQVELRPCPLRGWLEPAQGVVHGPKFAAGTTTGAHGGFLGH